MHLYEYLHIYLPFCFTKWKHSNSGRNKQQSGCEVEALLVKFRAAMIGIEAALARKTSRAGKYFAEPRISRP